MPSYPQQQPPPQQGSMPSYPQQQGYGGMPPMSPQQAPQQPAPQEVKQSYMLWLVAIGLAVISLIISVVTMARTTSSISGTGVSGGDTNVRVGGAGSAVATAIVGLILYGVWYLFIHKMRDGRQWARITLLVIGILSFLGFLGSQALRGGAAATGLSVAGGGGDTASTIVGVIEWIAIIGAVIMMFRPAANAYFRSQVAYA
jgi:hypothetical protein